VIKLDKIKIVTHINNISNINDEKFQSVVKEGVITEQRFKIKTPHLLEIRANYQEKELTIEFTSKILKDDCIQLINKNNIVIVDNFSTGNIDNIDNPDHENL
jgi:hypothetical protein